MRWEQNWNMYFALDYKEVHMQQSQAAPCGCCADFMGCWSVWPSRPSPVLYLWFILVYIAQSKYSFCWSPGSNFLKKGVAPISSVLSVGSVSLAMLWVGDEFCSVLQVFPSKNPLPDLSFPISPIWCRCLGLSTGVNSVPTLSVLCVTPGAVQGFQWILTDSQGPVCLKVKVAIKYLLHWPQEPVDVVLK